MNDDMVTDTGKGGTGDMDGAAGRRLHMAGLFVALIGGIPQLLLPVIAASYGVRGGRWGILAIMGIFAVALLFGLFFRWLSWLRFRYYVGDDGIRIEQGIMFRSARSIPFDRVQDVSIEQPLLPRLMNLAEVGFETGGGRGQDAKLRYVTRAEAESLRDLIRLRKASGATSASSLSDSGNISSRSDDGQILFRMDNRRLILFGFYSFSLIIFAALAGAAQQFDFLLPFDIWDWRGWADLLEKNGPSIGDLADGSRIVTMVFVAILLPFIGFATGIFRVFIRDYGFRLNRVENGLRRRRGLLTRSDIVMPLNRVQAVIVETGPVRQWRGWFGVKLVSLAADGGTKGEGGNKGHEDHVVAPFATAEEIEAILAETNMVFPATDMSMERGNGRWWIALAVMCIIPAILGGLSLSFFVPAGMHVAVPLLFGAGISLLLFLDWRFRRYACDGQYLFIRTGWWQRRLMIIPAIRVQTVELLQGPLTRRLGLAIMRFGIAGGRARIIAMPIGAAYRLRADLIEKVAAIDYSRINQMA